MESSPNGKDGALGQLLGFLDPQKKNGVSSRRTEHRPGPRDAGLEKANLKFLRS